MHKIIRFWWANTQLLIQDKYYHIPLNDGARLFFNFILRIVIVFIQLVCELINVVNFLIVCIHLLYEFTEIFYLLLHSISSRLRKGKNILNSIYIVCRRARGTLSNRIVLLHQNQYFLPLIRGQNYSIAIYCILGTSIRVINSLFLISHVFLQHYDTSSNSRVFIDLVISNSNGI